jgi:rRNA maturation endonuclease Nob1
MSAKHIFAKNQTSIELIPLLQEWLSKQGYEVCIVANRIDASIDEAKLKILIEDYGKGCTINIFGTAENAQAVASYLSEISEFGYTSSPCEYCGTIFPTEQGKCPRCGAYRKFKRLASP